ncbi:MAG: FMN-binding protein [Treponema sp.]|jgi:electron transport complex protein RnfG|nr:FMN-binding protein [Treponema sp.]
MKVWNIARLGLVLMLYTAAACVGLSFVYTGTLATIEERARSDLEASLKELFPSADDFEDITGAIVSPDSGISFGSAFAAKEGGKLAGVILEASGGSYGGPITVLVGTGAGGTIRRIKVMDHSDTPGLGANAASPSYYVDKAGGITFYGQFSGRPVTDPLEPNNDLIAITAATITSRAVARVVRVSGAAAAEWLAAEGGKTDG